MHLASGSTALHLMVNAFTTLPEFLIQQLAKKRVIPFVGAGLSMSAGLPDWRGLLERLSDGENAISGEFSREAIKKAISEGQYELAAAAISQTLEGELGDCLAKLLDCSSTCPSPVHELLASTRWPAVITTNYDPLLARAFPPTVARLTWMDDEQIDEVLHSATPHIMFAHGLLDRPETIVLTPEQYRKCLRRPAYRTYLKAVFTHYTALFLGFSFSDRDVNWLLEDLRDEFGLSQYPHFALVSQTTDLDLRAPFLRQHFNVETIRYLPSDGSHPEVQEFVRVIVDHCSGSGLGPAAVDELSALEAERSRLSVQEYLDLYTRTCRGLSQTGYVRTAWMALKGEIGRSEKALSLAERVRFTLDLSTLMIADWQFDDAHRMLLTLFESPGFQELDSDLLIHFAQMWFHTANECYYRDTLERALELAEAAGASPEIIHELETQTRLRNFLNGEQDGDSPDTGGGV